MKRVEIKNIDAKSIFKVTIYVMIIPMVILMILGLIMLSLSNEDPALKIVGIIYLVGMPVFTVVIYGPLSMLTAWIYNKLSSKFGGLEILLSDDQENLEK